MDEQGTSERNMLEEAKMSSGNIKRPEDIEAEVAAEVAIMSCFVCSDVTCSVSYRNLISKTSCLNQVVR